MTAPKHNAKTKRKKHAWVPPKGCIEWPWCKECGIIQNDRNKDAETCRGPVRIELRDENES